MPLPEIIKFTFAHEKCQIFLERWDLAVSKPDYTPSTSCLELLTHTKEFPALKFLGVSVTGVNHTDLCSALNSVGNNICALCLRDAVLNPQLGQF